jgi:hypothetical protein
LTLAVLLVPSLSALGFFWPFGELIFGKLLPYLVLTLIEYC